jgi:hypothetical protein
MRRCRPRVAAPPHRERAPRRRPGESFRGKPLVRNRCVHDPVVAQALATSRAIGRRKGSPAPQRTFEPAVAASFGR